IEAAPLPYLLSIPRGRPRSGVAWPLLCFLHGYDEGWPTPARRALTRHGPLRKGNPAMVREEFIIVAPQLRPRGDFWHRHQDTVREIVESVQLQHNGDPTRSFLAGFSFGGNGVFDLALAQPLFWRALWAVDPTRVPHRAPELPIWLSSGAVSRRGEARCIGGPQLETLQPEGLDERMPAARIYVDQQQNHVDTATLAFRDERIYRWLLSL